MFVKGNYKANISGNKITIEADHPKEVLKALGFHYSDEFKEDILNEIKSKFKINGTIEQLKDHLDKQDTKESKLYLNILHEIKPQCKINGIYYNIYYYHPNMSLLQVSQTYDLDKIMKVKRKESQNLKEDQEQVKKLKDKKEKLIKGGDASYNNMKKYYKINDKLSQYKK